MHPVIQEHAHAIAESCRHHHVLRLEVFGSAARGDDFDPERSDVDFLVTFEPEPKGASLQEFFDLRDELSRLLGRPIDLVERNAVEQSRNYIRRHHILSHVETVYVAG